MENRQPEAVSNEGTAQAARAGRDAGGRFVAGNPGGPGNPFARQDARVRRAFREAIGEDQIKAMVRRLYDLACAGNVAAAQFILAYCSAGRTRSAEAAGAQ